MFKLPQALTSWCKSTYSRRFRCYSIQKGFFYRVYQKNGRRYSNAHAYLNPAKNRPNLTIITNAHATEVLMEKNRAIGIRYRKNGKTCEIKATHEVVLSAGTFQSPQLLMLSGIGPREELEKHGIEVKVELPGVGKNLQDHLDIFVETRAKSKVGLSFHPSRWPRLILAALLYVFRRGELTTNVVEAGGFYKSNPSEPIPDIQWHNMISMNAKHALDLSSVFKHYGYAVMNYDLRPLSRGHVGLHSADPLAPPLIDPNLGAHERDIEKLVLAVKETRRVLAQKALAEHRDIEISPGEDIQTDEQLRAFVRETAEVAYHPVGTCKMGPASDSLAVVDARLRVHGVAGLRVVDCSIMPTLLGGNTNQPASHHGGGKSGGYDVGRC